VSSRLRVTRWDWPPGVRVASGYRRGWLRYDLVAGLTLTALLVPQGMAYAQLAGLPPINGLYATLVPLIAYAVFGPSRILVLGPDSAIAPLVAAAIVPLAGGNPSERVALAGTLALMAGAIAIVGGIARLGFLADLISKPVRIGYLAGVAATVLVGQLPALLGFSVGVQGFRAELKGLVLGLGETDTTATIIGLATVAVIVLTPRFAPKIPAVLVGVVGATAAVAVFGFEGEIATVGNVPPGLPSFVVPRPASAHLAELLGAAVGIALVTLVDTAALSRSYAARLGETVDQSRELLALGIANATTGLFQGFPVSSSGSRTPVAEAAGARTQATGIVAAAGLALVLAFATGLVHDIPTAALAAVIITAVVRLVDITEMRRLARVNRADFGLALACIAGVAVFGVLYGIAIAVGLSIAGFFWKAWHPHEATLGRVDRMKGYHDLSRHPEARQVPGLVLLRFDAPLFFANAGVFREQATLAVNRAQPPARWLIIAAEPITDVDSTAAEMLVDLDQALERIGIELAFAEMKGPVRDKLQRYGLLDRIGRQRFYPTIGMAVRAYVQESGVSWTDWEETNDDTEGPQRLDN
jgi:high affinity sulfate transporter 1